VAEATPALCLDDPRGNESRADRSPRVYAIGISAGAFESAILGADHPDLYAAIGITWEPNRAALPRASQQPTPRRWGTPRWRQ